MSTEPDAVTARVESWRATAFTLAGVIFAANLSVLVYGLVAAPEFEHLTLGQAFVGGGWTAGFLGLLGLYPTLRDRSRWLSRVGGAFAVVGLVTTALMAVVSLAVFSGLLAGTLGDYVGYFLPGVFVGIVGGFGSYAVATLLTGTYTRGVSLCCLLLVATFLFNLGSGAVGFNTPLKLIGVVSVLTAANLTLGYLFGTRRAETTPAGAVDPESAA